MATVSVEHWRTAADGETVAEQVEVEVSPEVLKILRKSERAPREKPFTDLGVGSGVEGTEAPSGASTLEPAGVEEGSEGRGGKAPTGSGGARWKGKGLILKPGAFEGPRLAFHLFLGEGRVGWTAGRYRDEQGECGDCRGRKLDRGVYCLGCDRCGRENELPTVPFKHPMLDLARACGAWRDDIRKHGSQAKAAKAAKAERVAKGEPEPEPVLLGGLGTKPKGRTRKQKAAARKGTGVNHFDLAALKLRNAIGRR